MTDESLGVDNSAPVESNNSQAQGFEQEQASSSPQQFSAPSGYITKDEANKVVSLQKQKAYEKGLREAQERYQTEQSKPPESHQNANNADIGSVVNAEVGRRMEEYQKQQQDAYHQAETQRVVDHIEGEFSKKLEGAKKIDGFDASLVGNFSSLPALRIVASNSDDADKVLAYLSANPSEAARLETTGNSYKDVYGNADFNPLKHEFKKIADRLKMNESGSKKYGNIPDPVRQIDTNTRDGVKDGTPKTAAEWASFYRKG